MGYRLKYTRQADKDARLLEWARLNKIAAKLLSVIKENPWQKYERSRTTPHGEVRLVSEGFGYVVVVFR